MNNKITTLVGMLSACTLASFATSANAQVSNDDFSSYALGSILQDGGHNGGAGWTSAWFGSGPIATISAGLNYPGLSSMNGSGAVSTAALANPNILVGDNVTTVARQLTSPITTNFAYLSFLIREDAGFGTYGGINLGAGPANNIFIGKSEGQSVWGIESVSGAKALTNINIVQGTTYLLVAKIKIENNAPDQIDLWVNPLTLNPLISGLGDATLTNNELGGVSNTVNYLYINNYGGYTTDFIRINTSSNGVLSFAELSGATGVVPEPGAFGLLAGVFVTYAGFAMKRRARNAR